MAGEFGDKSHVGTSGTTLHKGPGQSFGRERVLADAASVVL